MTATHTSVALPAVLMQEQAQAIADQLAPLLSACVSQGGEAQLDASKLSQFDSSAFAVILACRRAVLARGARLRIIGLPQQAQTLAQVYGLSELLS
jgi:phospholipid transport system transporter-binding protein